MSRQSLILSFIALFLLRFAIGFHFFNEGASKLQSGDFDARPFLLASKGPLKESFLSLVDDHDGKYRLCYREVVNDRDDRFYDLDPQLTFDHWWEFLNRASEEYQFGSEQMLERASRKMAEQAEKVRQLEASSDTDTNLKKEKYRLKQMKEEIDTLTFQRSRANQIVERYEGLLKEFLAANRDEIIRFVRGNERIDGFQRDGENRKEVVAQVESLWGQLQTIEGDREKKAREWYTQVEAIWDGLEYEINALATEEQRKLGPVKLKRPYDRENSPLNIINRWLPWFDLAVGCLLMVGLFSRLASLLGAGFLLSVIATQPPWVLGAAPTFYQSVEFAGLLVIFATAAGRYAGLDYFIHYIWTRYIAGDIDEDLDT